jgi:hypothetical protein
MVEEEFINFKAVIGGESFPLKMKKSEEDAVRQLIDEINNKLNHFQINYKDRNKADWLTMTLLTYAFDNLKLRKGAVTEKIMNHLNELDQRISALAD